MMKLSRSCNHKLRSDIVMVEQKLYYRYQQLTSGAFFSNPFALQAQLKASNYVVGHDQQSSNLKLTYSTIYVGV